MSRIIRLIDNETIEISDYRNSGYLFDHNAPTIEDIRKQISNIDDWCCFKETINPFVLYGEKEELQQRIDKAIKELEQGLKELDKRARWNVYSEEYLENAIDILRGDDNGNI